jgi:hypothetical protein
MVDIDSYVSTIPTSLLDTTGTTGCYSPLLSSTMMQDDPLKYWARGMQGYYLNDMICLPGAKKETAQTAANSSTVCVKTDFLAFNCSQYSAGPALGLGYAPPSNITTFNITHFLLSNNRTFAAPQWSYLGSADITKYSDFTFGGVNPAYISTTDNFTVYAVNTSTNQWMLNMAYIKYNVANNATATNTT